MSAEPITERFLQAQERLVTQASDFSLQSISQMVSEGIIDISPAYQRRERWPTWKQAALIESFLLNVPVPPVYLAEDEFGRYSVIDGKQRLTSIHAFLGNEFALTRLHTFSELDGLRFADLPDALSHALTVRPYIRAVTLLKQSDPELKYEVFTRLNTAGEPLNAQEIRNVAYRGPLNDLIYKLAGSDFLRRQLKIVKNASAAYRNMVDAEYVLRFLTLSESWDTFSGDLRSSMDHYMLENRAIDPDELLEHERRFLRSLDTCERLWGRQAFRRPAEQGWRDQTLAGMYDAQMIGVLNLGDDELDSVASKPRRARLDAVRALFDDEQFEESVRRATNTPSRVRYRISATIDVLRSLSE